MSPLEESEPMLYYSPESVAYRCVRRGVNMDAALALRATIERHASRALRVARFTDAALDTCRPACARLRRAEAVSVEAARLERVEWPNQVGVVKKFLPYATTTR